MRTILAFLLLFPLPVLAHEGHDHAAPPGTDAMPPAVTVSLAHGLSERLDIKTAPAQLSEVAPTLQIYGRVAALPDRQAVVSARFPAKVLEMRAQAGQAVHKGDVLGKIEPLVYGSNAISLTAAIDGIVSGDIPVAGQVVEAGTQLFEIIDLTDVLVIGQVYDSAALAQLAVGQSVRVDPQNLEGRIERLDPSLDARSRGRNVYIRVSNKNGGLLRHMLVGVSISLAEALPAVVVPHASILGRDSEPFVFIKAGDLAERRVVKMGVRHGDAQEIISGVLPDEEVIIQGHYQLQFAPAAEK